MNKETWIENYTLNLMAAYAALNYDHNCRHGWGEREQSISIEDAQYLAGKEWDRLQAWNRAK